MSSDQIKQPPARRCANQPAPAGVVLAACRLGDRGRRTARRPARELVLWTDQQAIPTVSLARLHDRRGEPHARLCPATSSPTTRRRFSPASPAISRLAAGYRRACEGRAVAGVDRYARSRSATRAGPGRSRQAPRPTRTWRRSPRSAGANWSRSQSVSQQRPTTKAGGAAAKAAVRRRPGECEALGGAWRPSRRSSPRSTAW